MKNADMPAMPVLDEVGMPYNTIPDEDCTIGLTKREYFAAKAMQAMVASASPDEVAALAVHYADELLKALEKTNDPE